MKRLTEIKQTKRFAFFSDAKKFQNHMKREGYKTKLISFLGIADPYYIVTYNK
jgi:hypothetical protein